MLTCSNSSSTPATLLGFQSLALIFSNGTHRTLLTGWWLRSGCEPFPLFLHVGLVSDNVLNLLAFVIVGQDAVDLGLGQPILVLGWAAPVMQHEDVGQFRPVLVVHEMLQQMVAVFAPRREHERQGLGEV